MNIREIMAAAEQGLGPMAVESAGTSQGACERHRRLGHKLGPECGGSGGGKSGSARRGAVGLDAKTEKRGKALILEYQRVANDARKEGDVDGYKFYLGDVRDVVGVMRALQRGDFESAELRVHQMETDPRERAERIFGPAIRRGLRSFEKLRK